MTTNPTAADVEAAKDYDALVPQAFQTDVDELSGRFAAHRLAAEKSGATAERRRIVERIRAEAAECRRLKQGPQADMCDYLARQIESEEV